MFFCGRMARKENNEMVYRYKLENGIEVVSEPMAGRRTVALGVFVKVGSQDETKENNGISHLLEHMFFKGTGTKTAKEIADITARIGDDVNAFTSKECTALYGMTITEKLAELAGLLGGMLTDPLFDVKELAKEKRIVMDEIDMYEDSPEDLVHELLQKRVWREDALGFIISGTKSVVRGISREKLQQFFRRHYCAENMLVSVAGGYEEEALKDILWQAFSGVKRRAFLGADLDGLQDAPAPDQGKGQKSPQATAAAVKREMAETLLLPPYQKIYGHVIPKDKKSACKEPPKYFRSFVSAGKEIEQLHMNLALPALPVKDGRRFACSILNSAFGGSNNSRLFQKIREEAGMAYSVYSYLSTYGRAGLFHIDITVQPLLAVPVLGLLGEVMEEFARKGLTEAELDLHKQQVSVELVMGAESTKTRMDSNAKYALCGMEIYTLKEKLAFIDAVDGGQVKNLAAEILRLPVASLCVVGDKKCTDLRGIKKIWDGWGRKI